MFPMARNPGTAAILMLNCLISGGVAVGAQMGGAPIFFPIIFGLIAVVILLILPDLWFYRSVVDISPRELVVSGGLFGLGATRSIAAADVKSIETRQGMFCGQTTYYKIVAVCNDGKQITLGKRLPGAPPCGGRGSTNERSNRSHIMNITTRREFIQRASLAMAGGAAALLAAETRGEEPATPQVDSAPNAPERQNFPPTWATGSSRGGWPTPCGTARG